MVFTALMRAMRGADTPRPEYGRGVSRPRTAKNRPRSALERFLGVLREWVPGRGVRRFYAPVRGLYTVSTL